MSESPIVVPERGKALEAIFGRKERVLIVARAGVLASFPTGQELAAIFGSVIGPRPLGAERAAFVSARHGARARPTHDRGRHHGLQATFSSAR